LSQTYGIVGSYLRLVYFVLLCSCGTDAGAGVVVDDVVDGGLRPAFSAAVQ